MPHSIDSHFEIIADFPYLFSMHAKTPLSLGILSSTSCVWSKFSPIIVHFLCVNYTIDNSYTGGCMTILPHCVIMTVSYKHNVSIKKLDQVCFLACFANKIALASIGIHVYMLPNCLSYVCT